MPPDLRRLTGATGKHASVERDRTDDSTSCAASGSSRGAQPCPTCVVIRDEWRPPSLSLARAHQAHRAVVRRPPQVARHREDGHHEVPVGRERADCAAALQQLRVHAFFFVSTGED